MTRDDGASMQLDWLQSLRDPAAVQGWSLAYWERVIRLARRLRLLGRLASVLQAPELLMHVPPEAARHLRAELRLSLIHI